MSPVASSQNSLGADTRTIGSVLGHQLQPEGDNTPLFPIDVLPRANLVADIFKLPKILVIAAAVYLLEEMQLSTITLMLKDGTVPPGHLHVAYLPFARESEH